MNEPTEPPQAPAAAPREPDTKCQGLSNDCDDSYCECDDMRNISDRGLAIIARDRGMTLMDGDPPPSCSPVTHNPEEDEFYRKLGDKLGIDP